MSPQDLDKTGKPPEDLRDLGFGSTVTQESRERFLNRDGSFNVSRVGLRRFSPVNFYHFLLTLSWWRFLLICSGFYLGVNLFFGVLYLLCGEGAVADASLVPIENRFWRAFFFSVQTFATIGYGAIQPNGYAANFVMTVESFVGIVSQAFITGLLFARFARPTAQIQFSDCAVIAPYRDITGFMCRVVNIRVSQMIEIRAQLLFARFVDKNGVRTRVFDVLELERPQVSFMPLAWTIVHPISENSPLFNLTEADLVRSEAEFLILLTGFDETFSQNVHARSSYKPREIEWNAKFSNLYVRDENLPHVTIDVRDLSKTEKVQLNN